MMRRAAVLAAVGALAAVTAPALRAQSASETVQVTLVEVPVTVVDRNGVPVRGLTAQNFTLDDDGTRREVTHFEVVDLAARTRIAAGDAPDEPPRVYMRNFLLLFDGSDSEPQQLARAREAALAFVTSQLQPADRVAVGVVGIERGFTMLANFTLDRHLVRNVIENIAQPKHYQSNDPLLLAVGDFDFMAQNSKSAPGAAGGGRGSEASDIFESLSREMKKNVREFQREQIVRRIDNLTELGRVLDRVGGRKQVILLSSGFDTKPLQGRSDIMDAEAQEERTFVERGQIWNVDSDARYGSSDTLSTLRAMIETMRRSDVVLNALDIHGLRNVLDENGKRINSTESLSLLTRDTGGTVFQNSNDLSGSFARLLAQQDVTYILGFTTTANAAGKYHPLHVKVSGIPAGARVSYRMGYYEQSRATVDLDRTLSAAEILTNSIPVDDVKVHAFAAAFPHKEGVAQAPVVLDIDGGSLLEEAVGDDLPADLYVYAFDRDGVARDFVFQHVSFDLAKVRAKLAATGVKFYQTLLLPPGDYSVRALVRTLAGRSGFAIVPLHVPAAGEAAVSPALLEPSNGWLLVKGKPRASAPSYPFTIGDSSFVPATRPALESGRQYNLALMTWNLPLEHLQLSGRIAGNGAAQPASLSLVGRTTADDAGGVKLMLQVTPPRLSAGIYRLVLTISPGAGAPERTVSLPFEVQ
jgi:VWFA-related protein